MGFVAMVPCLPQGDTQITAVVQPGMTEGMWEEEVSRAVGQCRAAS